MEEVKSTAMAGETQDGAGMGVGPAPKVSPNPSVSTRPSQPPHDSCEAPMAHPHDSRVTSGPSAATRNDDANPRQAHAAPEQGDPHPYASPASSLQDPPGGTAAGANSETNSPQHARDEQSHLLTPNASGAGRKRKASGAPGSRGVANLTAEQLAKKRANDREAQRAIRERTKNTIEGLERRILELESQQPYQDLQKVVRERNRARDECEHLRKTLATVASVVGVALNPPGLHDLSPVGVQLSQPPHLPPISVSQYRYEAREGNFTEEDGRSPTNARPGTLRRWSPSLDQALPNAQLARAERDAQQHPPRRPHPLDPVGVQYELLPTTNPPSDMPAASNRPEPTRSPDHPTPAASLPKNLPPTCTLDHILTDFVRSRRQMFVSGLPMHEILGPEYPSLDHLLDPPRTPSVPDQRHPMAALLIDTVSKFPDIRGAPEKAATLYMMFRLTRWQVCPCETCYQLLPEWMRPIPEQMDKPHAIWCDHIPWPHQRRALVQITGTSQEIGLEHYFIPFTKTFSINWPYPPSHILQQSELESGPYKVKMNPVFESHIWDLRNWSVGTMFRETFPVLMDESVRLEDRR